MTKQKKYRKLLVYGIHGAGKTELAGSAADVEGWGDVFLVSAEKGEETLDQTPRIKNKDKIFTAYLNNTDQLDKTKNWLFAHAIARDEGNVDKLRALEAKVGMTNEGPPRLFNTVVVDSTTEIQMWAGYKAKMYGEDISLDADLTKTEWPHYNEILDRMGIIMRAYRDLRMHTIFIAQATYGQDETKKRIWAPALQGQMQRQVQGFVDIVGFLQPVESKASADDVLVEARPRRLWVQPVGPFAAKSRAASWQGTHFDNPTMSDIAKAFGWVA